MRVQILHAFLLAAATFLALDDAYLVSVGTPTVLPFFFPVLIAVFPIAWIINRRRVELKRLGDKLLTPFWAGACTVATYFFLLSDMGGGERVSPLPQYMAPAILAILPALFLVRNRRQLFATKA